MDAEGGVWSRSGMATGAGAAEVVASKWLASASIECQMTKENSVVRVLAWR
jgi:hypothetical protein